MINKVLQIKDIEFEMFTFKQGETIRYGYNILLEEKQNVMYISDDNILPEFLTGYEYIKLMCDIYDYQCDYDVLKKLIEYYAMQKNMNYLLESYDEDMIVKIQLICAFLIKPDFIIINEILDNLDIDIVEITKYLIKIIVQKGNTILSCNSCKNYVEQVRIMIIHEGKKYEL